MALFAKVPRPGTVKTRLCPPLTFEEAAGLYAAFLRRVAIPHPGADTFVYGTPATGLGELRPLVAAGVRLRAQAGADLWERVRACFVELAAEGYRRMVVRNTDSPDLPIARVEEALAACAPGRVIVGPDHGGGYYLIALAEPVPDLFRLGSVPPEEVCARTCARARELGLEVVQLAVERDVDTYQDLCALWDARRPPPSTMGR